MDLTTDEDVQRELAKLQEAGALTFVLPTTPLGVEWVLGLPGDQMVKFDGSETRAFLLGAGIVATAVAERLGIRL